jgi:hypothetical protein
MAKFAKIGECCTRMPSVDGLLDRLLLFVNIFSMTIRAAVLAQRCLGQMPCSELLLGAQGSSEYPLVDQKPREANNTSHGSQIQIGSKSAHKHVRTDTDRAAGLMKDTRNVREVRHSSLPVYQTTAAGVTNAHRKPASVEPQQQIQRGFSLWAL